MTINNRAISLYDKKLKNNQEITNRVLDLINDSQDMTDSDIQGCLDAILLDYTIIKD